METSRSGVLVADSEPPAGHAELPGYLEEHYHWAYLDPLALQVFDRQWVVNLILLGNYRRLSRLALDRVMAGSPQQVLQLGCVYGDLSVRLAERLAPAGRLHVGDPAPQQLELLDSKRGDRPITAHREDASALSFDASRFDCVLFFFLLHELPGSTRARALAEALRVCRPGGSVIVVDYHRPRRQHPLRWMMRQVFERLEPFALDLWRHPVSAWLPPGARVRDKQTLFGDLYQVLRITR